MYVKEITRGSTLINPCLGANAQTMEGLMWLGLILAVVVLAVLVLMRVRRHLIGPFEQTGAGLELMDVQRMRDQGQLTTEEYNVLRVKLAGGNQTGAKIPPADSDKRSRPG